MGVIMTDYVNGFLFSEDKYFVALVIKQKPAWQNGKLNAIGGKIEPNELAKDAIIREFFEETGVTIESPWRQFCVLTGDNFNLYNYVAFSNKIHDVKTMEKEVIVVHKVEALNFELTIPNLRWLIPMALDKDSLHAIVEEKTNYL
jgi:8-oxo-dGTP diphosphatase